MSQLLIIRSVLANEAELLLLQSAFVQEKVYAIDKPTECVNETLYDI